VHALLEDSAYESKYIKRCGNATLTDVFDVTNDSYPFALSTDVSFHFFTTEAPCGDASMELLMATKAPDEAVPWVLPTDRQDTQPTGIMLGRGYFSQLGAVRRKPGRADSEATISKSCTDKLTIKQFTGLLSFPACAFVRDSTACFIETLVVHSHQFHEEAYRRAFSADGRLAAIGDRGNFFDIAVLPDAFPDFEYSRAAIGFRSKASNISALWIRGSRKETPCVSEVLHNGVKEGYKQFEARPGKTSIVCRRSLWMMGRKIALLLPRSEKMGTEEKAPALEDVACSLDSEMTSYRETKDKLAPLRRSQSKRTVTECLPGWRSSAADEAWSL
jgi:tRNA-specific adenosine deaminase 1